MNLYHEHIIDHYRYPRNNIPLIDYNAHVSLLNPNCGDRVELFMRIRDQKIEGIFFVATGCVISQATASLLSERIKEKNIEEIVAFSIEDLIILIGISLGPVRLKCATLSLQAVHEALQEFMHSL